MRPKKVAIIGAGICGLYLAWKLAERGHQVSVFEKKSEIGKHCCSGLFSERIFKFILGAHQLIENQIASCLIYFPKRTVKINFKRNFFVIERYKLDNLVGNLAKMVGAKFFLNTEISKVPIGFDYIIGCDGSDSVIRRNLRKPDPKFFLGIQGFIKKEDFSNQVEVWPLQIPHLFAEQKGGGFVWKIPRGKKIEYGIIGDIKTAKRDFQNFLREEKIQLKGINSAIIPQGLVIVYDPKVILCGDSAGLTKPWSGGGVIWGLTAADIILEDFPNFIKASKKIKKFFGPEILFSKTLTQTVYFLGFKFPWLLPKRVKIDGDFFLH